MPRPDNIPKAVQDLLSDSRFTATWAMLTSPSAGERASALEAVTRQLTKRGLDMRDLLHAASTPKEQIETFVDKIVEKVRVEYAHVPNAATINGFVNIIEELDIHDRDGHKKLALNISLRTTAYKLEPILVIEPHLVGRCRQVDTSRRVIRASLHWQGDYMTNGSSTCVLTGIHAAGD